MFKFQKNKKTTCRVFIGSWCGEIIQHLCSSKKYVCTHFFPQHFEELDGFFGTFFFFFLRMTCGRDAASMRQLAGYGFGSTFVQGLCTAARLLHEVYEGGGDSVYVTISQYIYIFIIHTFIYIYM